MCSSPLAFSCGPVGMVGISSFGALVNGDVSSVILLELPLSVFPGSSVPSVVSLTGVGGGIFLGVPGGVDCFEPWCV